MNIADQVDAADQGLKQSLIELCDDATFKELEAKLKVFNPFRVLKVERYELRHTTTLAWLLNPHESHGMGNIFLQCFLRQVTPANHPFWVGANTETAEVLAELVFSERNGSSVPVAADPDGAIVRSRERLDVLVEGRNDRLKWGVAIEAKIDSNEGKNQLERYDKWLTSDFENCNLLKLYLTVEPEAPPESPNAAPDSPAPWVNILWGDHVAKAMDAAMDWLERNEKTPGRRVKEFFDDYKELLSGLSKDKTADLAHRVHALANRGDVNTVLRQLKSSIAAKTEVVRRWSEESWVESYWKHRALLDMCMEHVRSVDTEFLWERVTKDLACGPDWHIITPITSKTQVIEFVPTSWVGENRVNTAGNPWNLYYHAEFRTSTDRTHVEVKLYLPPTGDRKVQQSVLKQIFGPTKTHPSPYLRVNTGDLGAFLMPESRGKLKLYSARVGITRGEDGRPDFVTPNVRGTNQNYHDFAMAVAAHTEVVEKLTAAT